MAKTKGQRKVWRHQGVNQKTLIEEGQKIQWSKERGERDKQWSAKHYWKRTGLWLRQTEHIRGHL